MIGSREGPVTAPRPRSPPGHQQGTRSVHREPTGRFGYRQTAALAGARPRGQRRGSVPQPGHGGTMRCSNCTICVALALLAACSSAEEATQADMPAEIQAHNSAWSEPVNLGSLVNSPFVDFTPEISQDGLTLYFGSDRPGSLSPAPDLWVSHRQSPNSPWETPLNLGEVVNSPAAD